MSAIASIRKYPHLCAFVAGIVAPTIITMICRITGTWGTNWWFSVAALAYAVIGAMVWRGSLRRTIAPLLLAYFTIPIGVVIDATIDWFIWHYDRNLFPFEIAFLFVVALVPLGVGASLGKILRSNRLLNTDARQETPRAG